MESSRIKRALPAARRIASDERPSPPEQPLNEVSPMSELAAMRLLLSEEEKPLED